MNKITLLLTILILTASCKKDKINTLQTDIEKRIKTGLNDPESYEFTSFDIDSMGYISGKKQIEENLKELKNLKEKVNDIDSNQQIIKLEDRIQNLELVNRVRNKYKYNGNFNFRCNNKFGANILAQYNFLADSTCTLVYLVDNIGDTIYTNYQITMKEEGLIK